MSKTIKVIDLLNKIANGEEVPKKIKWNGVIWIYSKDRKEYYSQRTHGAFFNDTSSAGLWLMGHLNDEVEIIEEEPEIDIQGMSWEEIGERLGKMYLELGKGFEKAIKQLDKQIKEKLW